MLPISTYSAEGDEFYIRNGVLLAYNGAGGDVVIPNSVTEIGWEAFADCTALTSVTIGNSIEVIFESTFSGCSSLTDVSIGSGVTCIDFAAFEGCIALKSVTIPYTVTEIGMCAFGYAVASVKEGFAEIIDNFTIYGTPGSAAEEYAKDNGFKFVDINNNPKPGDVNNDNALTQADVDLLAKYVVGFSVTIDLTLADVNGDGVVDMRDATVLARQLSK